MSIQKIAIEPTEITAYYEAMYSRAVTLAERDELRRREDLKKRRPALTVDTTGVIYATDEDVRYHISGMLEVMKHMTIIIEDPVLDEVP